MLVGEIGEFALIRLLTQALGELADDLRAPLYGDDLLGIGDDAAAWRDGAGTRILTSDAMVEGVHFDLSLTSWLDLGWKALCVNLSDAAAMGCSPTRAVVTLGLRGDMPVEGLIELYRGMAEAGASHGGRIVGGDIARSPVFFLSVSLLGESVASDDEGRGVTLSRGGAATGDLIAVTGSLGDAAGGLRMALAGETPDESTSGLFRALHRPTPRIEAGAALAHLGATSAIDVSDGLAADARKVCESSGVGAVIRVDDLPASEALRRRFPTAWQTLALSGGEDYELLFTASEETVARTRELIDAPITPIGEIVDAARGITFVDAAGRAVEPGAGGWEHFGGGGGAT